MTETFGEADPLEIRRRKLKFRAWHRGLREADLIMGRFADAWLARLEAAELDDFERLMTEVQDQDLLAWIARPEETPARYDTAVLRRLREFQLATARER